MGPVFYKNIPKHGTIFPNFKNVKNRPIFPEKSLKMDTFFCQNDLGMGFKAWAAHPVQAKSDYPSCLLTAYERTLYMVQVGVEYSLYIHCSIPLTSLKSMMSRKRIDLEMKSCLIDESYRHKLITCPRRGKTVNLSTKDFKKMFCILCLKCIH